MNNQAKIILASFMFFAISIYDEEEISPKMRKLFRKLSWLSEKYKHHSKALEDEINIILQPLNQEVNLMLLSVSLISEYYEQMKGKKRYFTPMSWSEIVDVQDECIALNKTNVDNTFDICEILVKELLNKKNE